MCLGARRARRVAFRSGLHVDSEATIDTALCACSTHIVDGPPVQALQAPTTCKGRARSPDRQAYDSRQVTRTPLRRPPAALAHACQCARAADAAARSHLRPHRLPIFVRLPSQILAILADIPFAARARYRPQRGGAHVVSTLGSLLLPPAMLAPGKSTTSFTRGCSSTRPPTYVTATGYGMRCPAMSTFCSPV